MVVSDETMAFSRWKSNPSKWTGSIYSYYDSMFRASERAIQRGRRSHVFDGSVVNKSTSYGYYVPNQWQGRYDGYIEVKQDLVYGVRGVVIKPMHDNSTGSSKEGRWVRTPCHSYVVQSLSMPFIGSISTAHLGSREKGMITFFFLETGARSRA